MLTARPQPNQSCKEIRLFEVVSSTDWCLLVFGTFSPNLFIDIENTWEAKAKALQAYNCEMNNYPDSRSLESIKNLAKEEEIR